MEAAVVEARKGTIEIFSPQNRDDNASLNKLVANANVKETAIRIDVPTESIDEYFASHPKLDASKVTYMKVDVQGFELGVLKGAKGVLQKAKKVQVEAEFDIHLMNLAGIDPMEEIQFMLALGFKVYTDFSGSSERKDYQDIAAGFIGDLYYRR